MWIGFGCALALAAVAAPAVAEVRLGAMFVRLTVTASCTAGTDARAVSVKCSTPVPYRIDTRSGDGISRTDAGGRSGTGETDIVTITYSISSATRAQ
jgi:hypothetical protein